MQTEDGSLKCKLNAKLSHRLIRDIFSIYDLYIDNKKMKSKPFNAKSQEIGML